MARTVADAKLDSRDARLKLKKGVRHWKGIYAGVAIGYRRGAKAGTWSVRLLEPSGKYKLLGLGQADDYADANGDTILSYREAHKRANKAKDDADANGGALRGPYTVAQAAADYLAWFETERKGVAMARSAVATHILPAFGERDVSTLRAPELRAWLSKIAGKPARLRTSVAAKKPNTRATTTDDQKRGRKASANRIYTVLRAILNRAFREDKVTTDAEWRKVKPFAQVDEARIRFLTDAESVRLVNACAPDLRELVHAALLTGARWGELAALRVADVTIGKEAGSIYIAESKSGRPRHVPLNGEGRELFAGLVAGKVGDARVFVRADGGAWGHNHHVRDLVKACTVAKIAPAVTFHELRHTYASHLAQAGIPLLTISKLLGHADTRITARHYAHLADATLADAVSNLPSFTVEKANPLRRVA